MNIKKVYILAGMILLFLIVVFFFVDQKYRMPQRVFNHRIWECTGPIFQRPSGEGHWDILITDGMTLSKDGLMIFHSSNSRTDTLQFDWVYMGTMKATDPHTGKSTTFFVKGSNWWDRLWR